MQHLQKGGKLSRMGEESDLSNEMWLAERMPQGTPSSVPLAVVSESVYLTLIRKSSSFLPLVHQLTKDAHHAMFSNEVLEVKWLTHQTTDWFTHTAHTHKQCPSVQSAALRYSKHTHAILRALPVFSLKKSRERPSFEASKKPQRAFQHPPCSGFRAALAYKDSVRVPLFIFCLYGHVKHSVYITMHHRRVY